MATTSREIAVRSQELEPAALTTKAVWAGPSSLTIETARALAIVGDHYGLDPALGHVLILGSKVYITKDGYISIAQRHPAFEGLTTRPLTQQERKDAKVADDEHAWLCEVYRRGWRVPAIAWGSANRANVHLKRDNPNDWLREMAEGRAIRRSLKLAFGLDLPDADEAINVETGEITTRLPLPGVGAVEPKPREVAPNWAHFWIKTKELGLSKEDVHTALRVDSVKEWPYSLAEALDICVTWLYQQREAERARAVTPTVEEPDPPFEPSDEEWDALGTAGAVEAERIEPASTRSDRPIPDVANWGQLWTLAQSDFGMTKAAALKQLGARSQEELGMSPRDAYAQLAEVTAGRLV